MWSWCSSSRGPGAPSPRGSGAPPRRGPGAGPNGGPFPPFPSGSNGPLGGSNGPSGSNGPGGFTGHGPGPGPASAPLSGGATVRLVYHNIFDLTDHADLLDLARNTPVPEDQLARMTPDIDPRFAPKTPPARSPGGPAANPITLYDRPWNAQPRQASPCFSPNDQSALPVGPHSFDNLYARARMQFNTNPGQRN